MNFNMSHQRSSLSSKVVKSKEMWMGREALVFTTSWFLSFPFLSKQRKWDSAAPSGTVVHSWTGLIQCGLDNHLTLYHPRGSALLHRYFFCKHRRSSSLCCLSQGAKDQPKQKRRLRRTGKERRTQTESMNESIKGKCVAEKQSEEEEKGRVWANLKGQLRKHYY